MHRATARLLLLLAVAAATANAFLLPSPLPTQQQQHQQHRSVAGTAATGTCKPINTSPSPLILASAVEDSADAVAAEEAAGQPPQQKGRPPAPKPTGPWILLEGKTRVCMLGTKLFVGGLR